MSRIYSTHLNYITLQKTDLKSTEAYRKAGSESKLIGLSHLPLVENIGFAEKRLQHDGQEIATVYPIMYFSKVPRRYANAPFVHESNFWCNKNHMAYYKARPGLSMECLNSSEYYFEDGLRKVRPYYQVREANVGELPHPMTISEYHSLVAPYKEPLEDFCEGHGDWFWLNLEVA